MDDIINPFNYYVFSIIGISIEIIGVLFISLEAIGLEYFSKNYNLIYKFSKWSKKSFKRMLIITIPSFMILTIGILFNIKIIVGLFIPIIFFSFLITFLIDHPRYYENWIIIKAKQGKISIIGFLIIIIGNLLQIISQIWQMNLVE